MKDEYKLFPGCLIPNRLPFLEASAKYVFDKIGLKTSPAEFACCPNPVGLRFVQNKSWLTLGARNIALAETENKDIISLCNGCFQTLALVDHELKANPKLKAEINDNLKTVGREYHGSINIEHFVKVLAEPEVIEKIKGKLTHSLEGLKVAVHPGCHYARPSHKLHVEEDVMDLKFLKNLVRITGATVVEYDQENLCCGNVVRNSDPYTADTMLKAKFDGAMAAGADILVCNCPSCFQQFDSEQRNVNKIADDGKKYKFPIIYITELLALAMGATQDELGLKFHRNNPKAILKKVNL